MNCWYLLYEGEKRKAYSLDPFCDHFVLIFHLLRAPSYVRSPSSIFLRSFHWKLFSSGINCVHVEFWNPDGIWPLFSARETLQLGGWYWQNCQWSVRCQWHHRGEYQPRDSASRLLYYRAPIACGAVSFIPNPCQLRLYLVKGWEWWLWWWCGRWLDKLTLWVAMQLALLRQTYPSAGLIVVTSFCLLISVATICCGDNRDPLRRH